MLITPGLVKGYNNNVLKVFQIVFLVCNQDMYILYTECK